MESGLRRGIMETGPEPEETEGEREKGEGGKWKGQGEGRRRKGAGGGVRPTLGRPARHPPSGCGGAGLGQMVARRGTGAGDSRQAWTRGIPPGMDKREKMVYLYHSHER